MRACAAGQKQGVIYDPHVDRDSLRSRAKGEWYQ